ncbi:TetR family transcriptional regulator [Streptomyces sp. VRA16 Mangrove soil]|uniref:TetR/AcrR family transcriptional regulator n=1 Tax=Streptomyces sp. VRA16 Mangrove soil TaxID=2817434 RepID=UPI001A9DAA35|nr:TetR family transcriptional regulator [Streptomyces sp. VRA16 Mangrove soil]MBO1333908.1 TetR family transcriptional regulator [Streptomyces sp. VRA16 Mangrove soil]
MTDAAPVRRRGRPARARTPEGPDTRERILTTARDEFAARGYDKTSVRAIAKAAGVDSALVHHYFGTKEQVFEASIATAFSPALQAPAAVENGPLEEAGERLTRFILGVWENPATRAPLLAIVRSAVNNDTAAAVFRRLVAAQLLARIGRRLDVPEQEAELRVSLAAAQLVGTAMLRYVIKVEPLASADVDTLVARLAPVVQNHLTGPGPD